MKPSICFVSLNNYAVLSGDSSVRHIGGAEVQQAHLARGLAERGHRVTFVTLDHGQPDGADLGGLTIFKAYARDAGVRALRFLHPRLTGLWSAMRRADADLYYQRGIDLETGLVAAWCRRNDRKFVFALAHDSNCCHDLPSRRGLHERILCRYGLRQADRVISQTEFQRSLLRDEYGLDSDLIRSCAADPMSAGTNDAAGTRGGRRLLWVGRFSREKRLDLLLDLAECCPEVGFDIVGKANVENPEAARLAAHTQSLANVTMHGYVPAGEMGAHYARAAALICTSSAEGFPNTFLEAWSRGVPVITTVDPDGLVAAHGLGVVMEPNREAAVAVRGFAGDAARIAAAGLRARAHFVKHHGIAGAVDAYERVVAELTSSGSAVKDVGPPKAPLRRAREGTVRETVDTRR